MTVTTTVDWALAYGRVSWRVFPLRPLEKRPVYVGWQRDATTDPDLIRRYWAPGLDRNIGAVAGEAFDAWDIEAAHLPAFREWREQNGYILPEAPQASTGRGGLHILTAPTGVNSTRYLYLGKTHIGELKSTGGFIALCPSTTEQMYRWAWTTERMVVPEAPDWLLGLLERPASAARRFVSHVTSVEDGMARLEALAGSVRGAGEGKRNNVLYWAMRRAIEEGIPHKFAFDMLHVAALSSGLEDHETRATLSSAVDAESTPE